MSNDEVSNTESQHQPQHIDEEDDQNQSIHEDDDDEQMHHNPVEYVEDTCERNQNAWLRFPNEFIRPAKMCSINKYVQCVDHGFMAHSMHHIPTGPEFVLVGHDSPSLPQHMFKWIWAMSQINLMKQYCGCVVPVMHLTEVTYNKKGKLLLATNIKRRLVIPQAWQMDEQMRYETWFPESRQETLMMESIQELRAGNNHYADVSPIQLLWGIVPVEYELDGIKTRRIFHVLKTIPAPGFDLMRCLVDISRRTDQRIASNGVTYSSILQAVQDVINYECNCNLHIVGFFGRSHPLPHPIQVMDDPSSPMNPQAILSPFLVLRKILLQLPVSRLKNLVVDGFPKTETAEQRRACFTFFKNMQEAYRRRLAYYHQTFGRALNNGTGGSTKGNKPASCTMLQPVLLPLVLSSPEDESLDNVFCFMNMTFNLNKWLEGSSAFLDRAELLRMPQLAIATLTPFQYVAIMTEASPAEFIRAHVGDAGDDLDETKLGLKYSMDNGSWGDIPHAGMFKSARESIRTSLKTMQNNTTDRHRISTYHNYLRAQSTIHTQSVLVDLMMSDRVLHCAQCLDRLSSRINASVRRVFQKNEVPGQAAKEQRQLFAAYPDAVYYLRLLHTLSFHNKHIRANAVNLTALWAILVSDVLTHLGAHHETWNWMMYTVQVMGGAGHLRAQTDDHGSRIQVIFTSKPNSVGFNAVITKTFKAFSTLVTELLPDLSSDFLEPMRFMKLDRTTRSGVESVSAVMFVNGVRELAPDRKTFMRPIIMDEGYRSMDSAALNGLVCSIPRDSDGGSGNILKAVENKAGGAHLQGHQRQIPGLSPFLLAMTSNSNPHTSVIGECIKTFSVVTAMFPAGAQPGGKLSQIHSGRKRKISDYQSSNTNAASTMPSSKEEREDLAWIMCVLLMATRQLALINKTGQVNFEINIICRTFIEWLRNMIQSHFMPFFSSMLLLSYDRVIAGYLTRQVATTFMATCARHYAESESMTEANPRVLMDMETAPITLQTCNLAICNAITHLVDTNLLLVNQIIRDKLKTPVVSPEFMVSMIEGDAIDTDSPYYDLVFSWLSQMVQGRQNEAECIMGYVAVPKLGTHEDYNSKEAYLESYFGVAKNNYYTYLTAVKECCSKTFDLTDFLSIDGQMLDFTRFISRMGVGGDGIVMINYQQQTNLPTFTESHRSTFLFSQIGGQQQQHHQQNAPAQQDAAMAANQQRNAMTKCWVNIIQHLLITAIQGNHELHADNMFVFGAKLTEFILSRCAPIQSLPAGHMALESFRHTQEEVLPHTSSCSRRPEYFVRTIKDHGALELGRTNELPAVIGAHPPEDAMHLGAWIQLYTILHSGELPSEFHGFDGYNGRPPELVLGRRYPLVSCDPEADCVGTILLDPAGQVFMTIGTDESDEWVAQPPAPLDQWWETLNRLRLMVAPLIFRRHAAFRTEGAEDSPPWVAINYLNEGRQFLSKNGKYTLSRGQQGDDEQIEVTFSEAHRRLLPIGTHMLVKTEDIRHFGFSSASDWILGSLRYPDNPTQDELSDANQHSVYLTIRIKVPPGADLHVKVVHVPPTSCRVLILNASGGVSSANPPHAVEAIDQAIVSLMGPRARPT